MLGKRLVVVSNRLPIVVEQKGRRSLVRASTGGLVTALSPIMEKQNGLWIGWLGETEADFDTETIAEFRRRHSYDIRNVILSQEDIDLYYFGFSNSAIWPLFHDLLEHCNFRHEEWNAYHQVNRRFAEVVAEAIEPDDVLWIHDYQLMMVGQHLRALGVRVPLSFFLHIPFPSEDLLRRLPWHKELLRALLDYDLLGFQSERDRRNFVNCVRSILGGVDLDRGERCTTIHYRGRSVKAGHFPISIDFDEFSGPASSESVAKEIENFRNEFSAKKLVLGVDRLDYTKGIPHRFRAFERALEKYADLRGNVSLFQLVIPSRTNVKEYQNLKLELDQLVGEINGRFYRRGWIPIYYMYGRLDRTQLIGRYCGSDIALITPLRDGMNLVAKEYCASQVDEDGVLLLSQFAGTAEQLTQGPITVNPYDLEGTADAIYKAYHMDLEERNNRMRLLRDQIRRFDVHRWVREFFETFGEEHLFSEDPEIAAQPTSHAS